jgi:G3E family GTPase
MLAIEPIIKSGAALIANIIVVYDACRNPLQGQDSGLIKDQLITADTILINKADLVPSLKTGEIQASIAQLNRQAELVITSQSAVDAATLLKKQSAVNIPPSAGKTSTRFRSFGFHVDTPLSRQGLERWLKTLPASVVRVKGFVRLTGYSGFYEVQSVFGQSSITAFDQFIEPPELLVLITHPMRTDGLVRRLQKCVIQAEKQVTQTNQN